VGLYTGFKWHIWFCSGDLREAGTKDEEEWREGKGGRTSAKTNIRTSFLSSTAAKRFCERKKKGAISHDRGYTLSMDSALTTHREVDGRNGSALFVC
jgi:hypothetical protein